MRTMTVMRWSAAILGVMLTGCSDRSVSIDEIEELENLREVHVTVATAMYDNLAPDAHCEG